MSLFMHKQTMQLDCVLSVWSGTSIQVLWQQVSVQYGYGRDLVYNSTFSVQDSNHSAWWHTLDRQYK